MEGVNDRPSTMMMFPWIVLFCFLFSISFQQPLPSSSIEQEKALLAVDLGHNVNNPSSGLLFKRTSPERDIHPPHEDHDLMMIRRRLLEQWDKVENSPLSIKKKEEKRKVILNQMISTVPYHPEHKRSYVKVIYRILGKERVEKCRKQINRNIRESVPESDRPAFTSMWGVERNVREKYQ